MGYNVLRSLAKKNIQVVAGDSSGLSMCRASRLKQRFFKYRSFYHQPESFIEDVLKVAGELDQPVYIPTHEETFVAAKYAERLTANGVQFAISDYSVLRQLHKKTLLHDSCVQLEVPTPRIEIVDDEADFLEKVKQFEIPVVLKADQTNSAKGVYYLTDPTSLLTTYRQARKEIVGTLFLQELVTGHGYGVSVLMNRGRCRARFTHKRLREKTFSGGTSTARVSTRNQQLEDAAVKLLSGVGFHGVAMVEFKYDEVTDNFWIIDVNPRFWGSLALPIACGVNFPYLLYQMITQGDVDPVTEYEQGVVARWVLGDLLSLASEISSRRRIVDPMRKYWRQPSGYRDDFFWDDPMPFVMQSAYYLSKFISSGGDMNPKEDALIDLDRL